MYFVREISSLNEFNNIKLIGKHCTTMILYPTSISWLSFKASRSVILIVHGSRLDPHTAAYTVVECLFLALDINKNIRNKIQIFDRFHNLLIPNI